MTATATESLPPDNRRPHRWLRVLLALVVVAIAAMWVYAFAFASRTNVNSLGDPEWAARAETTCAAAREAIARLPATPDLTDESPEALATRGDVVADSNEILQKMLDELGATMPDDQDGARIAGLWLGDWRTYLADRVAYADGLRAGTMTRLSESTIDGMPITNFIGDVARQNRMASCQAPLLT